MSKYSQGICQDGAAILKDGQMMTIEEILAELNNQERLVKALVNMVKPHCGKQSDIVAALDVLEDLGRLP